MFKQHATKTSRRVEVKLHAFLTSTQDRSGQPHDSAVFFYGRDSDFPLDKNFVCPTTDLMWLEGEILSVAVNRTLDSQSLTKT